MLRIGEFSKLSKTTVKTLRYYDKVGLLKPAFVDSFTGYRYYTNAQLETMHRILMYKRAGMQNADIAEILQGKDPQKALRQLKIRLQNTADELAVQIAEIDAMLDSTEQRTYTAQIKAIDACKVFYCRGYIVALEHVRSFAQACAKELYRTNPEVHFSVPDYCCVIYPGENYRKTNIFIEYAQSVDRIGKDTPGLKFKTLEPITAVSVEHHGSYENLRDAYLFAVKWAAEHGFEVQGDARECYINGAWNCTEESDWLTEVQLPVRKLKGGI